jgi:hypothetical protein
MHTHRVNLPKLSQNYRFKMYYKMLYFFCSRKIISDECIY